MMAMRDDDDTMKDKLQIFSKLKKTVKLIDGADDIMKEMLEQCLDYIENQRYTTPDDKYRYLRALPHIMVLLDHAGGTVRITLEDEHPLLHERQQVT